MEKISGILPSSTRITTVDLKNSGHARAGAPSFGRPQNVSTAAELERKAKLEAEMFGSTKMNPKPVSNDPHVAIVEKMANDFFLKREAADASPAKPVTLPSAFEFGVDADLDPSTGTSTEVKTARAQAWNFVDAENVDAKAPVSAEESLDQPERGGNLDVHA